MQNITSKTMTRHNFHPVPHFHPRGRPTDLLRTILCKYYISPFISTIYVTLVPSELFAWLLIHNFLVQLKILWSRLRKLKATQFYFCKKNNKPKRFKSANPIMKWKTERESHPSPERYVRKFKIQIVARLINYKYQDRNNNGRWQFLRSAVLRRICIFIQSQLGALALIRELPAAQRCPPFQFDEARIQPCNAKLM